MLCLHAVTDEDGRLMTDNIFEFETIALAHLVCAPQEVGYLLDGLRRCIPQRQPLLDLPCYQGSFVDFCDQFMLTDSNTEVEFAGKTGGHFFMARGVGQGCPASGFLLSQETLPPLTYSNPLRNDIAVAALSFRSLMAAPSPAFVVIDRVAGLNLNHRK